MDIDRLNSNQAVCNHLVELMPWESIRDYLAKPFYKVLCQQGIYWTYNYFLGGVQGDNSCYLMNRSHPYISSNMTETAVYEKLRACGLRHKKAIKLMKLLESLGRTLYFSPPINNEGIIFYKGNFCLVPDKVTGEISFPLLFTYSEWIKITRENNLGFDNMPRKMRHRRIFNTIRHNITVYDAMMDVTDYGNLARKLGDAVIKEYPLLRDEVLSYWERKEENGEVINTEYDRFSKPVDILCGMESLKKDLGEDEFYRLGLAS